MNLLDCRCGRCCVDAAPDPADAPAFSQVGKVDAHVVVGLAGPPDVGEAGDDLLYRHLGARCLQDRDDRISAVPGRLDPTAVNRLCFPERPSQCQLLGFQPCDPCAEAGVLDPGRGELGSYLVQLGLQLAVIQDGLLDLS
jgi:hypothetical protein